MTNEELVTRMQDGEDLFEELYHNNVKFIHKMARIYSEKSMLEKDDLVSEFMYILYKCAHSYDIGADNKFITFFGTAMLRFFMKATDRSEYVNVYTRTRSLNVPVPYEFNGISPELIDLIPSHHQEFTYEQEIRDICTRTLTRNFSDRIGAMVMEYFDGETTVRELGEKYQISYQAVALNVKRAREVLRLELIKHDFI